MAGKGYWAERIIKQQDVLYRKGVNAQNRQLARYYKVALEDTKKDIGNLYDKLVKESIDGNIKVNDLYRYNRYFEVVNNLNKKLNVLGQKEIQIDNLNFKDMYKQTCKIVGNNIDKFVYDSFTTDREAKQVLESLWVADGKHWSDRVWDNKSALQQQVEKGMVNCVSRGASKDELVKTITKSFNTDFYKADRIARTELSHIQNTACANTYKTVGITQVQTIISDDERLCDECSSHENEIHDIADAVDGVAFNFHCGCRCSIVPVLN